MRFERHARHFAAHARDALNGARHCLQRAVEGHHAGHAALHRRIHRGPTLVLGWMGLRPPNHRHGVQALGGFFCRGSHLQMPHHRSAHSRVRAAAASTTASTHLMPAMPTNPRRPTSSCASRRRAERALKQRVDATVQQAVQAQVARRLAQSRLQTQVIAKCASALQALAER